NPCEASAPPRKKSLKPLACSPGPRGVVEYRCRRVELLLRWLNRQRGVTVSAARPCLIPLPGSRSCCLPPLGGREGGGQNRCGKSVTFSLWHDNKNPVPQTPSLSRWFGMLWA